MKTSAEGRALIESMEGLLCHAYKDGRGIPTIGFGHTNNVRMGETCTEAQADAWLEEDLGCAESAVNQIDGLTQNQFDALVSLVFNIGQGNFSESTVRRKLRLGETQAAADAILMWNRINGEVSPGLQRRREAERALFLK